ncbi:hypothetical protein [Jatrophihabitans sp.]|uniref:hypothetical protein n=1 Tax=Jatrophihabitans sp. TaxID=1932789 RepID=UPI0030C6C8E3|nr:hypothetical protein [Jatrophihabitans sp.]
MTAPAVQLDWRNGIHWSRRRAKCRVCKRPTNLRDDKGRPSHKVCAEQLLARLAERVAS